MPLEDSLREASRLPLVGRIDELTRLIDTADTAVEHGAQMVLLSGEAGMGKSTLVGESLHQLHNLGWGTHVGHCIEYADRPLPFGPIVAILRSILLDNLDNVDEITAARRDDLAGLLPELGTTDRSATSLAGDVDRLFDAIAAMLTEASQRRPLAVLVEDIHWADAATRDLLAVLIRNLGRSRVLLVVTERSGAIGRTHPLRTWLAEHRRLPNVRSVELEGLSRSELDEQATNLLGEAPNAEFLDDLVARTHGNPYYSQELLAARRAGDDSLPSSLVDFLTSRIERLSSDERTVLRALAVSGGSVNHARLATMTPELALGEVVRSLFDAAILTVDGSNYMFGHALLREAILRDVLPFEAEHLHRRAAESILADPRHGSSLSDLVSIALHWSNANDPDRGLAAAVRAAEAASTVAAYEAAADMSLQALWAWPAATDPEATTTLTRHQLLLQTAEWLASCYRGTESVERIEEALADWAKDLPTGQRALLLAQQGWILWNLGDPGGASRGLAEALRLIGDEVSPEAARVHHRLAKHALLEGQIHHAREAAERAIAIAESHGPKLVLVETLTTKALAIGVTEDLDRGIALAREARELALGEGLVSQVANTYRTEMLMIHFQDGRTEACLDASRDGLAYAEKHCGPRWRAEFRDDLCLGYVEGGRLSEATPLLELLLDSELDDFRRLTVLQTAGLHALSTGTLDRAATLLHQATEIAARYDSAQETGAQWRLQAELARRQGDLDQAIELIDRALELQLLSDNLTYTRESIVEKIRVARACEMAGHPAAARLAGELVGVVNSFDGEGKANAAMRALMDLELASLQQRVEIDQALQTVSALETAGFLYEAAQARLLLLDHRIADGSDRTALSSELTDLQRIARDFGMAWIETAVTSLARTARVALFGADKPAVPDVAAAKDLPHFLTAREVEVMSLLAEGLTNKGIGERLYVSPRTVSTHISNLLAKLGAGNRGEAAAAYHRLGLAETIDLREQNSSTVA